LGSSNWVIIDSCIDNTTGRPAALEYLAEIGVQPKNSVKLIIATHWHDDHIRGMAELVSQCNAADFCCSSALGAKEFLAMVATYKVRPMVVAGAGIREIDRVFEILDKQHRIAKYAAANRPVFVLQGHETDHGQHCTVTTLSPSDKQVQLFHAEIAALIPGLETKRRCAPQSPNHLTVATWVQIGDLAMLLGGDLEEIGDPATGWSVIVNSPEKPQGHATIFKVPHHGSANAHHEEVWKQMLVKAPFAILAPWNRATKLPRPDDIKRITNLTDYAYSTAKLRPVKTDKAFSPVVGRQLRDMGLRINRAEPKTGAIRLRNKGKAAVTEWQIELRRDACELSQVYS
jgi:beta-lactamase superfamily II metal-dependent hydrolase